MFGNMKLGTKLLVCFLIVGITPFAVVSVVSLMKSSSALNDGAYNQLISVRDIKADQIERFFGEREGDMGVLMETVGTLRQEAFAKIEAVRAIKKDQIETFFAERMGDATVLADSPFILEAYEEIYGAFDNGGGATSGKYQGQTGERYNAPDSYVSVHDEYFDNLKFYMEQYGYYDLFLMDSRNGDVCFTVTKEGDFGKRTSNIDSSLRDVWSIAAKEGRVALSDTKPYSPSNDIPAQFVAAPIKKSGQVVGVVALQISNAAVNAIMSQRAGMGETGETYLVGQDYLMRSDSFLDPVNHSVASSFANPSKGRAQTKASTSALSGSDGAEVILDYNGAPVLSSWAPVVVGDHRWALLAEIDVAEAFCPVDAQGIDFYAKYIELYGYYDLFLMNPDGYCFYSVGKEADYQTNFVNGKYASSGLGKLTREVLDRGKFGVADFAPYAPSGGEPSAFIAQPVIRNGKAELVVGLQLSLKAINTIMGSRAGMGETGETYLIGEDKLMRSDSYLDPQNHTVVASFANPTKGCVDTEAAREVLSGKTDEKIVVDYNGANVLSAYRPVKVGNLTWGLLAEIDEAEAFAAVNSMKYVVSIIALIGVIGIVIIGITLGRSITGPINRIIAGLKEGADQVSSASGQVSSASQSLAEGNSEQAASMEETSSSLVEMTAMAKSSAENANEAKGISNTTRDGAIQGTESMKRMATAIDEIKKSSDETSKIIKTIDEIAFQTNLLALNAAVEAARAGDAGKGFAVVAEEVRNLAQRSAEAAKNTSAMIEESVNNADRGVEISSEVGHVLEEITSGIQRVNDLVGTISEANATQAQGIDQINSAVTQMDSVTQSNAANAEESASASEEMSAQAEQLNLMVQELVGIVGGSGIQHSEPSQISSKLSNWKGKATRQPAPQAGPRRNVTDIKTAGKNHGETFSSFDDDMKISGF